MRGKCGTESMKRSQAMPRWTEPIEMGRRRSLSMERPKLDDHDVCPFINKLPLEVRLLIYRQVIKSWAPSPRLHIVEGSKFGLPNAKEGALSYLSCAYANDEEAGQFLRDRGYSSARPFQGAHGECYRGIRVATRNNPNYPHDLELKGTYLSLLRSCRTM